MSTSRTLPFLGGPRRLLRTDSQVAAGYHHAFVRRRAPGAAKLLASGLEKLEPIPDGLGGLALDEFRRAVATSLHEVRREERGAVEIAVVPHLTLLNTLLNESRT